MENESNPSIQNALSRFHDEFDFGPRKFRGLQNYSDQRLVIDAIQKAKITGDGLEKAIRRMWTLIQWCHQNRQSSWVVDDKDRASFLRHPSEDTDESFMIDYLKLEKLTRYQYGGSAPSNMGHDQVEDDLFGGQEAEVENPVKPKKRASKNKK